ncbi:MAG: hypothetical protein R3C14_51075 [Caldilineaceae bacterium]
MVQGIGGIKNPNNDFVLDRDLVIEDANGVERIRLDHETGGIIVRNHANKIVLRWEMPGNNLRFGGQGNDGDLVIFPSAATNLLDAEQGTVHLNGEQGTLRLGAGKISGQLVCLDDQSKQTIQMKGEDGSITGQRLLLKRALLRLGANQDDGDILLYRGTNLSIEEPTREASIHINGGNAHISAGGQGTNGQLVLRDEKQQNRVSLEADRQRLEIRDDHGNVISMMGGDANLRVGTNGRSGNAYLYPAHVTDIFNNEQATIRLDGDGGNIFVGGQGADGDLVLRSTSNQDRIRLDADGGNIWVGGNGADGDIALFAASGDNATLDRATIHLNGDSGDIILQNADCAEDFEVEILEAAEPGTVMVISDSSRLQVSNQAYDRRVAGIVAGAGQYRPGIILGRNKDVQNTLPIALMGRVNCKVDANNSPIGVGDLLTTSLMPGYAMKVTDPEKAFGSVIGKALGELQSGTGMIPVLVALQ